MSVKQILRRRCLERRDQCADRAARSRQIRHRLVRLPAFQAAQTILLYMPIGSEVDVRPLVRYCLLLRKRVCLPLVNQHAHTMQAVEIHNMRQLTKGAYGILEPPDDAHCLTPDVVVVPGIAFDLRGNRIGYGAGYYDRFLVRHPYSTTVGVCYGCCMVEDALPTAYDVPMQWIITEERTIRV